MSSIFICSEKNLLQTVWSTWEINRKYHQMKQNKKKTEIQTVLFSVNFICVRAAKMTIHPTELFVIQEEQLITHKDLVSKHVEGTCWLMIRLKQHLKTAHYLHESVDPHHRPNALALFDRFLGSSICIPHSPAVSSTSHTSCYRAPVT
jgi:hypothetical protein